MRKAKSRIPKKSDKSNPNHIFFTVDYGNTIKITPRKIQKRFWAMVDEIRRLCEAHNALFDMIQDKRATAVIDYIVDQKTVELNHLASVEIEKARKLKGMRKPSKTRSDSIKKAWRRRKRLSKGKNAKRKKPRRKAA